MDNLTGPYIKFSFYITELFYFIPSGPHPGLRNTTVSLNSWITSSQVVLPLSSVFHHVHFLSFSDKTDIVSPSHIQRPISLFQFFGGGRLPSRIQEATPPPLTILSSGLLVQCKELRMYKASDHMVPGTPRLQTQPVMFREPGCWELNPGWCGMPATIQSPGLLFLYFKTKQTWFHWTLELFLKNLPVQYLEYRNTRMMGAGSWGDVCKKKASWRWMRCQPIHLTL